MTLITMTAPLGVRSRHPTTRCPRTCSTGNSTMRPSAESSLHHCSPRSEKNQRAVDKLITLLKKVCCQVCRCLSVIERDVPLWNSLIHLSQTSEKNPCRGSKNEHIRILLERQTEQILADCGSRFKDTSSKPIIQKMNGIIESQRSEINHTFAEGDVQMLDSFGDKIWADIAENGPNLCRVLRGIGKAAQMTRKR